MAKKKDTKKFSSDGYRMRIDKNEEFFCDKCGIGEKDYDKIHPWSNWNYNRDPLASFRLSTNGGVLCGACHKEKELEDLFKLMDARDEKIKLDKQNKL